MSKLIVPVRDRRSRKRIVTLKNFGWVVAALVVTFVGLTVWSSTRHNGSEGYGRLFGKQVARQNEIPQPKFDVIKEAPVADQTAPDPYLVEPAARAQYLGVEQASATAGVQPIAIDQPVATSTQSLDAPRGGGKSVTIVGGSNGVAIVKRADGQKPTLSGGIFKQQ